MFVNWTEKFRELSHKTKIISQAGAFFVSIFAFLSLGQIVNAVLTVSNISDDLWSGIIIAIVFHLILGVVFGARFVSLFFYSEKSFRFSQIVWFVCILGIAGYFVVTRYNIYGGLFPPKTSVSFGTDINPNFFLHASDSFVVLLLLYFFTSPLRQVITAIAAFSKS
jgi:uncharacterized protein (DUF1919 family)